jgi:hypothetical protein
VGSSRRKRGGESIVDGKKDFRFRDLSQVLIIE